MHFGCDVKCRFAAANALVAFALPGRLLEDFQVDRNVEFAAFGEQSLMFSRGVMR